MVYNVTAENLTNYTGLVRFTSEATGNFLVPALTMTVFIIVFMALGLYSMERRAVAASFVSTVFSAMFLIMGIDCMGVVFTSLIVFIGSAFILIKEHSA